MADSQGGPPPTRILPSQKQEQQREYILELVREKLCEALYLRSNLTTPGPQTELSQVLKFQTGEFSLFLLALTFSRRESLPA